MCTVEYKYFSLCAHSELVVGVKIKDQLRDTASGGQLQHAPTARSTAAQLILKPCVMNNRHAQYFSCPEAV